MEWLSLSLGQKTTDSVRGGGGEQTGENRELDEVSQKIQTFLGSKY